MRVVSKRITENNFSKFGKVVMSPTGSPTSEGSNYKFWSDIADYSVDGETEVGICTVYRESVNTVTSVERHIRTPEILIPIDLPFILPVLLEGKSDEETEAFEVAPGEVAIINGGVWHAACLPAKGLKSSYFVIFRKNTPHDDVVKKPVLQVTIEIE